MRNIVLKLAILSSATFFGLISLSAQASDQKADTVYSNGRIYTANTTLPWAHTIAVRGNKIIYVGDEAGAAGLTGKDTETHRLNGRLVLPGLIDAHTHPGYIALASRHLQLPEASSREDLFKSVANMVQAHPKRKAIIAMPWDSNLFDTRGPHKRVLDKIEPNRPLLIWDSWMHTKRLADRLKYASHSRIWK